jgi:hypothetical protein
MFTTVPLTAEGSLSPVRQGRGRKTSDTTVRLASPGADWWCRRDRRWLRRAAAARSRRRTRGWSVSGEAPGGEVQHATMGARVGPREGLEGVGRRRELAGVRARSGGNGGSVVVVLTCGRRRAAFYSRRAHRASCIEAKPSRCFNAWVRQPWHACTAGGPTAPRRACTCRVARGLTGRGGILEVSARLTHAAC